MGITSVYIQDHRFVNFTIRETRTFFGLENKRTKRNNKDTKKKKNDEKKKRRIVNIVDECVSCCAPDGP